MTPESSYLHSIAQEVVETYLAHTHPRAILLTGSVATGEADAYSDVDLVVYYDELPSEHELGEARERLRREGGTLVGTTAGDLWVLRGVECQLGFSRVETWERQMASILEGFDAMSPLQKAIAGMLHGVALYGADVISEWQRRASVYPDGLARAMVEAHLHFFPIWRFADRLATRDATVWHHEILVETCQNLLGVLAGLNHLYHSPFQFKRMHRFVNRMVVAPENLADRVDRLFAAPLSVAVADVERLVGETVTLVEGCMPDVDTAPIRRDLSVRDQCWPAPRNETG